MKRESYIQLYKHVRPFCSDKFNDLTCPPANLSINIAFSKVCNCKEFNLFISYTYYQNRAIPQMICVLYILKLVSVS